MWAIIVGPIVDLQFLAKPDKILPYNIDMLDI